MTTMNEGVTHFTGCWTDHEECADRLLAEVHSEIVRAAEIANEQTTNGKSLRYAQPKHVLERILAMIADPCCLDMATRIASTTPTDENIQTLFLAVQSSCWVNNHPEELDSYADSVRATALRLLAQYGRVKIIHDKGRHVVATIAKDV